MGDSEKRAVLLPVDDAETDDDQWEYYDDSTTLCDFWQVCILSKKLFFLAEYPHYFHYLSLCPTSTTIVIFDI